MLSIPQKPYLCHVSLLAWRQGPSAQGTCVCMEQRARVRTQLILPAQHVQGLGSKTMPHPEHNRIVIYRYADTCAQHGVLACMQRGRARLC